MLKKLSHASLPREAKTFLADVRAFLRDLDEIMKRPSTVERGRMLAASSNALEMAADVFDHFGINDKRWLRKNQPKAAAQGPTVEDGFGSVWSKRCPTCKKLSMQVMRPGKVQCSNCS